MRLFALIGAVAVLILPFAYTSFENSLLSVTAMLGLLWYNSEGQFLFVQGDDSGSFSMDWLEEGGLYESWFGSNVLGILILALIIITIVVAATSSGKKNRVVPGLLLIATGILITILRLVELGDADLSFYSNEDTILGERTYFEIPIALILSLIFGILDLRND